MSSRNRYLNPDERQQALFLSQALIMTQEMAARHCPPSEIIAAVAAFASQFALIRLDYFDLRRSADLSSPESLIPADAPRAIIAAFCGNTRLIDNMPVFP
jgi:pantoate--beta-alanine ligase